MVACASHRHALVTLNAVAAFAIKANVPLLVAISTTVPTANTVSTTNALYNAPVTANAHQIMRVARARVSLDVAATRIVRTMKPATTATARISANWKMPADQMRCVN